MRELNLTNKASSKIYIMGHFIIYIYPDFFCESMILQ